MNAIHLKIAENSYEDVVFAAQSAALSMTHPQPAEARYWERAHFCACNRFVRRGWGRGQGCCTENSQGNEGCLQALNTGSVISFPLISRGPSVLLVNQAQPLPYITARGGEGGEGHIIKPVPHCPWCSFPCHVCPHGQWGISPSQDYSSLCFW